MIDRTILEQKYHIDQPKIYQKSIINFQKYSSIKYVSDNTFLNATHQSQKVCLKYIDFSGKILSILSYQIGSIEDYLIISTNKVLILEKKFNSRFKYRYLIFWDLRQNKYHQVRIDLLEQDFYLKSGIFYFNQSQLVCFWQKTHKQRIRLHYYKLEQVCEMVQFHQFTHQDFLTQKQLKSVNEVNVVKINEWSGVVIIPANKFYLNEAPLQLALHQIDLHKSVGQQQKLQLEVSPTLNPHKFDFLQAKITDVWSPTHYLLYIQIETEVELYRYDGSQRASEFDQQEQERYHTIYYSLSQNIPIIGKINIPSAHRLQFINSIRPLHHDQLTHMPKTRIQDKLEGIDEGGEEQLVGMAVYYAEPNGDRILMVDPALGNIWEQRLQWISEKNYTVAKSRYLSTQSRQVAIYKLPQQWYSYSCGLKTISVSWMTQLMEECCEDLLDVVAELVS